MTLPRAVVDTNVLIAGLRSRRGWSFRLLQAILAERFEFCLSVALVFEYEHVCQRLQSELNLDPVAIDDLLDYLCWKGRCVTIDFGCWPELPDPGDDMLLELAAASRSDYIVTFNQRDFRGSERFGIQICNPKEFMANLDFCNDQH